MKKSEKLDLQASKEHSGSKAFGLHRKAHRERGLEEFVGEYEGYLKECGYLVEEVGDGNYTVNTNSRGIIDIYPKSKKLRIRSSNQWVTDYRPWIKKHLLNG